MDQTKGRPGRKTTDRAIVVSLSVPMSLLQRLEAEAGEEGRFSLTVRELLADALARRDRRRKRAPEAAA